MAKLANKNHEKFARGMASGLSQKKAHEFAYGKKDNPSCNVVVGNKLANRPDIIARVHEILSSDSRTGLESVISRTADALDCKKEVIYNSKGDSKLIDDPAEQREARRDILKLHQVPGFVTQGSMVDNRTNVIAIGHEDVGKLAQILRDLKEVSNVMFSDVPEQTGEIIDVTTT